MSDYCVGTVRVLVQVGEKSSVIGYGTWGHDRGDDPQDYADSALEAWDKAREQAEKTLRLYGAEGLVRALLTPASAQSADAHGLTSDKEET